MRNKVAKCTVLILVLVEDGLGEQPSAMDRRSTSCLNPCFSGGWSRRVLLRSQWKTLFPVLILVLVEDGLGAANKMRETHLSYGLNPCFSGGWSRSFLNDII